MICHAVQEAVSVRADGELQLDPVLTENEVDQHLETCDECIAFEASARQIRQALRIEMVAGMPDFSSSVLEALPQTPGRSRRLGQAVLVAASVGAVAAMSAVIPTQSGDLVAGPGGGPNAGAAIESLPLDPFGNPSGPTVTINPTRVIWSPTAFDDETAERVADNVVFNGSSIVGLSEIEVALDETTTASLEVLSFDPNTYPDFVDEPQQASFASLDVNQVVVSVGAAEVHGLASGDMLSLGDGLEVEVAAIVPDEAIADAEIAVVTAAIAKIGDAERFNFVLVNSDSDSQSIEAALEEEIGDRPIVAKNGTSSSNRPVPKDLPDAEIAGESSSAVAGETFVDAAAEPVAPNRRIKRATVPLLGEIRCHQKAIRSLSAAMTRLETRDMAQLIDPETIVTCFEPETTLMTIGHADHSTGMALDIYVDDDGVIRPLDRRVRKVLANFGFMWDTTHATHFEFVEPVADEAVEAGPDEPADEGTEADTEANVDSADEPN